tara:strand:- start:4463 stop:5035 length:573 start_codon:yes stop_codon:yes gene_type:complete
LRVYGFDNPRKRNKDKIMKKHYLGALLFLFYVDDAAALPDCPASDYFDNCYGVYVWSNAEAYIGEWKNGTKHGKGTYMYPDGENYVGEYKDNKRHGQGIYSHASGDKYVGEFKYGNKHGKGTYFYANGDKHVGEYKDDIRHGLGTTTFANGLSQSGYYINDNFIPDICEGMGLKNGSDAFGECVLKLMND